MGKIFLIILYLEQENIAKLIIQAFSFFRLLSKIGLKLSSTHQDKIGNLNKDGFKILTQLFPG